MQIVMLEVLEKVHQPFLQKTLKNLVDNEHSLETLRLLIDTLGARIVVSE